LLGWRQVLQSRNGAEDAVHESEIPFNVLAEAAADGIILIDEESTILFVNPAAARIFGYAPAEMHAFFPVSALTTGHDPMP
jgi:two-component system, LuxR family, sensor kinase FixL